MFELSVSRDVTIMRSLIILFDALLILLFKGGAGERKKLISFRLLTPSILSTSYW